MKDTYSIAFDEKTIGEKLLDLSRPVYIVQKEGRTGITHHQDLPVSKNGSAAASALMISAPALPIEDLGDLAFKSFYNTPYAYYAGSMAHAISSERMVIEMGKAGFLCSYGAGGVPPRQLESAIINIQQALPNAPYAF